MTLRVLPSRVDKDPPASFYANLIAYLAETYPNATLSEKDLLSLKPLWDKLWRAGRNAEATAQSTCTCDGKTIFASPAIDVDYRRGVARAPLRSQRGQLTPLKALRESSQIETSKRLASKSSERAKAIRAKIADFVKDLQARPPRTEAQAEAKRQQLARLEQELAEAIDMARAHLQQAEVDRASEGYSAWRKHLPSLEVPTKPQASPAIEVVKKEPKTKKTKEPKAAKAAKAPQEPKAKGRRKPVAQLQSVDQVKTEQRKSAAPATDDRDQKMESAIGKSLTDILKNLGLGSGK